MQHDMLPHNANLHLWGKKASDTCPLCHADNHNLVHVLNLCQIALNLRRYNDRHDSVLTVLYATISQYLPESVSSTVDLDNHHVFPSHIVSTDLRPDIIWWSDKDQSVCSMELTVCYDTLFHEAATQKEDKYLDLLSAIRNAGYNAKLITVKVGSQGLPNMSGFENLRKELKLTKTQTYDLKVQAARRAMLGSFSTRSRKDEGPL